MPHDALEGDVGSRFTGAQTVWVCTHGDVIGVRGRILARARTHGWQGAGPRHLHLNNTATVSGKHYTNDQWPRSDHMSQHYITHKFSSQVFETVISLSQSANTHLIIYWEIITVLFISRNANTSQVHDCKSRQILITIVTTWSATKQWHNQCTNIYMRFSNTINMM